jgi:hypothetical protein
MCAVHAFPVRQLFVEAVAFGAAAPALDAVPSGIVEDGSEAP